MQIEKISNNRVKLIFTVKPNEFEHALDHAFDHVKTNVEVKGFRKGKVTRTVYENKFGVESLYEEALNHLVQHKFTDALEDETIVIVSHPKVHIDFETVARDKEFVMGLEVAIKPPVELGQYKKIEITKENFVVKEEEVNAFIQEKLSEKSNLEPKKTSELELGDTAIFDFEGFKDGVPFEGGKAENYSLKIGSNQFIPGFEIQMVGMKLNESKELNIVFPQDYQAEELAGQAVIFKVKVNELKVEVKPELNDDWVKSLDIENVSTTDEFKLDTRKKLEEERKTNEKNRVLDKIIETACQNATVDIPVEMIDQEVTNLTENVVKQAEQYGLELEMFLSFNQMTLEQFDQQIKKDATTRILQRLVIEAIGINEKILPSEEEIDTKYDEIKEMYPEMGFEEIKNVFPKEIISENVVFNKTIDFLSDSAIRK